MKINKYISTQVLQNSFHPFPYNKIRKNKQITELFTHCTFHPLQQLLFRIIHILLIISSTSYIYIYIYMYIYIIYILC